MTALVLPDTSRWRTWAAMVADFGSVEEMHGSGHWNLDGDPVATREGCADLVAMTRATAPGDEERGMVASTYFWIAATDGGPDDELVGFLHLRHRLNAFLLEEGGHVGYSVRPAARRRAHATAALAAVLPIARERGLERLLVTCDVGNEASARTIARHGGTLEDVRNGRERYWIELGADVSGAVGTEVRQPRRDAGGTAPR